MISSRHYIGIFSVILLTLSACSPTTVTQSWKDESFNAPLGRLLILGVSENPTARRVFEQKMAQLLVKHGVHAEPSYNLLPSDQKLDKDEVKRIAKANGLRSILVTRVASVRRMKENRTEYRGDVYYGTDYRNRYAPSRYDYNRDWYDYYGRHRADTFVVEKSQRQIEWLEIGIDSSLFLLEDKRMVWSASLVSNSDQMDKTITSIATTLVEQMKKDGVYDN